MIIRSPYPDITIPEQSLPSFVLEQARYFGDRPAYVDGLTGEVLSFAELVDQVERIAAGLSERGLRQGDVCMLHSPNCLDWPVAYYAILSLGGVVTAASPLMTAQELAKQLQHSRAAWLFTSSTVLQPALLAATLAGIEHVAAFGAPETLPEGVLAFASLRSSRGGPPSAAIAPDDLAVLLYSSGTTGLPKGVMLTHRNLATNILQVLAAVPMAGGARFIAVAPFCHIVGLGLFLHMLPYAGSSVVLLPRFDLEQFLATIQDYQVTHAFAVPPIVLALAKHPLVDRYDLSSLERIYSGSAPLQEDLARACAARLGCRIQQGWGMTELSGVSTLPPHDLDLPATVGVPLPNTELKVVDITTGAELGSNQQGELWVRGPQVMHGYLDNPEATAATITADGWLRTGDIGYADSDGHVSIVDRLKELIKYKGYQIAPAELEAVLLAHPAVADAAVIGVPDEEAGEIPKAFVVRAVELSEDELMDCVAQHVAPYKRIRRVEFVDAIPKSPTGKILRRVLIERERGLMPA